MTTASTTGRAPSSVRKSSIITYHDFIPALLGPNALPPYSGYKPDIDPSIANSFSTAAFRVGHTLLSATLRRLDANNQTIGDLDLSQAFFNPTEISGAGIEPYLRGLASQIPQEVDCYLVDGVRNFLFGPPGAGGFDLASLNIQRGRDHGLPRYNQVRQDFGLAPKTTFAEITSDPDLQAGSPPPMPLRTISMSGSGRSRRITSTADSSAS